MFKLNQAVTPTQITHLHRLWLYGLAGVILLFLIVPCLIVIPMSFSASQYLEFPPREWSLRWYQAYLGSPEWMLATWVSFKVAIISTLVATLLGTLAENLRLGRDGIEDGRLWQALEEVQLADFVRRLPDGLATLMEEGGKNLSAGQRQLLSFARALVGDPRILILDEATASVDSQTELALSQALSAARRGRTTIAIAHRLSTIVDADEILLLSRGWVSERGTHGELMALGGHYAQLFEMQSQGAWLEEKRA